MLPKNVQVKVELHGEQYEKVLGTYLFYVDSC